MQKLLKDISFHARAPLDSLPKILLFAWTLGGLGGTPNKKPSETPSCPPTEAVNPAVRSHPSIKTLFT